MKNLGDITKISGYNAPIVDVVIGGSPCQDLSIAGKRAGLAGERSGLYMEQIRIIKEMRENDRANGRTGEFIRPRYMVWENVPGAFSSNNGKDFASVLEEAVRIIEPEAPSLPVPEKGWPTSGCLMGDGWSVAYRVLDAQYWGVPQRRRRIALVADFGGDTAPEILFERESVSGDSQTCGTQRQGTAGDDMACVSESVDRVKCLTPWDCQSKRVFDPSGTMSTYQAMGDGGGNNVAICIQGNCIDRSDTAGNGKGWRDDDVSFTLNTIDRPAVYDARGNGDGKTAPTLTGDHQNRITDYTVVCIGNGQADQLKESDKVGALNCIHDQQAVMVAAVDCRNGTENPYTNGTLQAHPNGSMSLNLQNTVRVHNLIRRLTPLECERLQGFPSRKEIDIREMTKDEYIAWNLQCGNIVADPESGKVFTTRGHGGVRLSKPKELLGSTVNGYKVVSIRNGTTKLQCRIHRIVWISVNGVVPNGYCIDHINSDKQDNRLSNLQLLTPIENSHKAEEDGLYKTGEDNKATKISPELYDEIAYLYATDDFTMRELAEVYGISKSRISQIIKETGWTDIGAWTDSKGKLHKESSDSSRYKALGNSIALPPWKWVLKRLCAQYERDATMASLFDGIGGFPLIWEQLNGKGSCVWSSEIDEFPIAVTRERFR